MKHYMLAVEGLADDGITIQKGNLFFECDEPLTKSLLDAALKTYCDGLYANCSRKVNPKGLMILSVIELGEPE